MIKIVLKFLLFSILSLFFISTTHSQTIEVQGFVPNKGQFSKKGVLGQFSGAHTIFYLTDTGLSFDIIDKGVTEDDYIYKIPAKHHVRVLDSKPISFDSIELYDSSSNTLNYYLPHCKDGILDIRAYTKIVIKSILPGIDWEIRYDTEGLSVFSPTFSYKFIQLDTSKPNSNIILQIQADRSLDTLIYDSEDDVWNRFFKNVTIELKDTLSVDTDYGIFDFDTDTNYVTRFGNSKITQEDTVIRGPLKTLWNADWRTMYTATSTTYHPSYQDSTFMRKVYPNALDLLESSTDISGIRSSATDNNGNYYIVGASVLNAQERSTKDSVNYYTEAIISKFDTNSKLLWTTFYGSSLSDVATTIAVNSKNDIYLSGHINLHPLKDDLQKMSLDSNYNPTLWENDFPTKKHNEDSYFSDTGSLFILKLNDNGKRQWATLIGKDYDKNSARDVPEGAYFFVILYKDVTNVTRKQAGTLTLLR